MSTAFEAFLATAIFLLLLTAVVGGVSYILNSKFSELRRVMLRGKAEAVAQAVALFIEVNPESLEDKEKFEEELGRFLDGYVHEVVLGEVKVVQVQVNITFPLHLIKYDDSYKVIPPVNVYVVKFLLNGNYVVESVGGGVVKGGGRAGESALAVVASDAVYMISSSLTQCNNLPQTVEKGSYCYIVHVKGATPCVATLRKGGDETAGDQFEFEYDDCCFTSIQSPIVIKKETIPGAISWLRDNGYLSTPYGILCPSLGCYYVYPMLEEPIVLFRSPVPSGVIVERASTLAVVSGCAVLVEVMIWD
jgi:hypothetical protein